MNRRGLVLSVLAVGAAGFGGAAWYATRPQPIAEAVPVAPEVNDVLIRPYSPKRHLSRLSSFSIQLARPAAPSIPWSRIS